MSQLTHQYINRIPQREENLFLEEYYSGTDVKVYMSSQSEPETEIAYISYSVSEQLKPMYGYASRTWDDVAVGTRIVTGTFKMSIKNPEEQSSKEEVIVFKDKSTIEEIADLNKQEEEKKQQQEWLDNETPNNEDIQETFSQEVQDYQLKLMILGFTISVADGLTNGNGEVIGDTLSALLVFCNEHGITPDNKFTTAIKQKIDALLSNHQVEQITTVDTAILRIGPGNEYGIITTLASGTTVYLLEIINNWVKVKTLDNISGYILISSTDREVI